MTLDDDFITDTVARYSALPERQKWAIFEAKAAFYQGDLVRMPDDLTDEAAALMEALLKIRLETRPGKESR